MLPPMEKHMVIITAMVIWRLPFVSTSLKSRKMLVSPITLSIWIWYRQPMKLRYLKTAHGVVCTASSAGVATADVIREEILVGISIGESRCVKHWTGCAIQQMKFLNGK